MKKIVCGLLLSALTLTVSALEKEDFDKIVDFSLDIKALSRLAEDPAFDPSGKRFVVFDGSVAGVTIMSPRPDEFIAELLVAGGEWEGTEALALFRVYVYAFGPEFAARIDGEAADIGRNNRLLVAGEINTVFTDETDGKKYMIIFAHHIRVIS